MTKPGFLIRRLIALFNSDDTQEQLRILSNYNKIRKDKCYCGHTTTCDCGNPYISEFKNSLETYLIPESILDKIID